MAKQVTPNLRRSIYNRDRATCQYCGIVEPEEYVVEHVIPEKQGGDTASYNLVVACRRCNIIKGNRVWIPNNLELITENHPDWRALVRALAVDRDEAYAEYKPWNVRVEERRIQRQDYAARLKELNQQQAEQIAIMRLALVRYAQNCKTCEGSGVQRVNEGGAEIPCNDCYWARDTLHQATSITTMPQVEVVKAVLKSRP